MAPTARSTPEIYLIRHGQTEWSVSGQHTGRTDIPLTERGRDEARELRQAFRNIGFLRVLTSPRQRARETCALAGLGSQAEINADLSEWDYGDYEARRSADIRKDSPDWDIFQNGCPGGETPRQVSDRADRLLESFDGLEGNIALFSHGHFGRSLAVRWIGLPIAEARHFWIGTASVGILGYDPNHKLTRIMKHWNIVPRPTWLDEAHPGCP